MSTVAAPFPLTDRPVAGWRVRDALLTGFFVALAFSISGSQALLTVLVLLALPWTKAVRTFGHRGWLAGVAREVWRDTEPLRRHPLTPPLVLYTVLSLLSAIFSGDAAGSLWLARDTLRAAAFYLVLSHTRDSGHAFRLWTAFLAALTVMATYGLVQANLCAGQGGELAVGWPAYVCPHPSRISGPFSIYMTFGGVLLLGALLLGSCLAYLPWRTVWWMLPAGGITVAALALTYSRNAWLGLAAGTLGLAMTARRSSRMVVLVLAAGLVVAAVSSGGVRDRMLSMANPQDETIRDRLAMWRSGLSMVADHPFLGVGPGQVRVWYPHYRRPDAVRPSTGHLHSSPVHIAAERGLAAFGVWIWLWVAFFREAARILMRVGPDQARERALVSASVWGVGGFLVAGLFEHNFGDGEVVMLVYALIAMPWVVAATLRDAPPPAGAAG